MAAKRMVAAHDAWLASLPDDHPVRDLDTKGQVFAWAEHMDATTVDRAIN